MTRAARGRRRRAVGSVGARGGPARRARDDGERNPRGPAAAVAGGAGRLSNNAADARRPRRGLRGGGPRRFNQRSVGAAGRRRGHGAVFRRSAAAGLRLGIVRARGRALLPAAFAGGRRAARPGLRVHGRRVAFAPSDRIRTSSRRRRSTRAAATAAASPTRTRSSRTTRRRRRRWPRWHPVRVAVRDPTPPTRRRRRAGVWARLGAYNAFG